MLLFISVCGLIRAVALGGLISVCACFLFMYACFLFMYVCMLCMYACFCSLVYVLYDDIYGFDLPKFDSCFTCVLVSC